MSNPRTVNVYGRSIELEPLEPGEEVVDVVVVVRTRRPGDQEGTIIAAGHRPNDPEPPRMTGDIRYLASLGLSADMIAQRAGRTPTAITNALRNEEEDPGVH